MRASLLPVLLLAAALPLLPARFGESDRPALPGPSNPLPAEPATFEAARELLDTGKVEEARAAALEALSATPYAVEGYRLLFDAAAAAGDVEDQIRWGKWLYWANAYGGNEKEAEALSLELDALWPEWNLDGAVLEAWRGTTEAGVKAATSAKQFRVAGHLMGLLLDLDPTDEKLRKDFDRLVDRAGEQISGGAFVAAKVRRRSPNWIAKMDAKHEEWGEHFERRTKNYEILTNISYEFFETVCVVMDDVNDFYREIYGYKKKMPIMTLAIHRKRSDFDKYCHEVLGGSLSLGVGGWFYDRQMTLAAYDRTDGAGDLTDLYRVLFHEASHQFMYLMCEKKTKQDPPTWLNEGTASYFEGCELKADGTIVKNKPAYNRVREWERIEDGPRRHSLEDLVTVPHRGYDGSYYSYGWALVYFLLNYEENDARVYSAALTGEGDEDAEVPDVIQPGRLVYKDAYDEYLQSYTKKQKKGGETAFERAKRLFVEEIGDPDVPDWEAFEKRWRTFTQSIVREVKSGPDFADTLQARCRGYLEAGDFERALNTAEQADDKRPNDGETYRLLALSSFGANQPEEAVYWMLRHWESALSHDDVAAADAAEVWLAENEARKIVENYCVPTRAALDSTVAAMNAASESGHPLGAMLFGAHFMRATGLEPPAIVGILDDLEAGTGRDLRIWLDAYPEGDELNRKNRNGEDLVRVDRDGILVNSPDKFGQTNLRSRAHTSARLAPPFQARGKVIVEGPDGGHLMFGIGSNGRARSALVFYNQPSLSFYNIDLEVDEEFGFSYSKWRRIKRRGLKKEDAFTFDLDVKEDATGALVVNGGEPIELAEGWDPERLSGGFQIGSGHDTVCLWTDVELKPKNPFWPVAPQEDDE